MSNSAEIKTLYNLPVDWTDITNIPFSVDATGEIYNYLAKVNAQTGTAYTLDISDKGKVITFNNASAITVTLPNSIPAGFVCTCIQKGAGQVTFSAGAGATLHGYGGKTKISGQYGMCSLYVDSNSGGSAAVYFLDGNITT